MDLWRVELRFFLVFCFFVRLDVLSIGFGLGTWEIDKLRFWWGVWLGLADDVFRVDFWGGGSFLRFRVFVVIG